MLQVYSSYLRNDARNEEYPIFAFEDAGLIYIWKYDSERKAMLCQYAGIPNEGKTIEEHVHDYIDRKKPMPTVLHTQIVSTIPGSFHPRIYRPGAIVNDFRNTNPISDSKAIGQSLVAINILLTKLKSILATVELNNANMNVFGHEIRNLLLLSSMETESIFSSILRENRYAAGRWNTTDYVKLCSLLHLDLYEIQFTLYPDFDPVKPFLGWNANSPTQSLNWYDSYNKTKHDREQNLYQAKLIHAVSSVCGVVALLHAQFGPYHDFWKHGELSDISLSLKHQYNLDEYYIPLLENEDLHSIWRPIPLPI